MKTSRGLSTTLSEEQTSVSLITGRNGKDHKMLIITIPNQVVTKCTQDANSRGEGSNKTWEFFCSSVDLCYTSISRGKGIKKIQFLALRCLFFGLK